MITLTSNISINHVSLTRVTFHDEVLDISSLSVPGDVNDIEEVECHPLISPNKSPRDPYQIIPGGSLPKPPEGTNLSINNGTVKVYDF